MMLTLAAIVLMSPFLMSKTVNAGIERCSQGIESDCYYVVEGEYAGLKEFRFFWMAEIKGSRPSLVSGKAYINDVFIDLKGRLDGDRLSFVTAVTQGFSYQFVGRFLPGGQPTKDGKIHIEGKLMKLQGSQRVVLRKVEFFIGRGSDR